MREAIRRARGGTKRKKKGWKRMVERMKEGKEVGHFHVV
jgi:hypothetical protein